MGTYKESFCNLINRFIKNGSIECIFYDFANDQFAENAQSRICHLALQRENEYNRDALLMVFTIGQNVGRVVIQSEGVKTTNPSSTYPQKIKALKLAKENNWKYIALAISSEDFENETIRDYIVSIESTSYAKATVCVLDDCIAWLRENGTPDFYRCKKTASDNVEYTLSFIKKDKILEYISLYDNRFEVKNTNTDIRLQPFNYDGIQGKAINKIFYGVPGCGKSYHIENKVLKELNVKKEHRIRTTFYQDYSNTDFVGQILPRVTGEKVEYIFNPGPFTLALIQAYKNPEENVALIVEEINRGNAPAIFGDVFQLLDRKNGVSEYGIKNVQIIDYLNDYNFGKDGEDLYYHFDEIKIPGNLYIYATMNTSDQNVYTLDTAFTRRWDKAKIPNDFVNEDDKDYFKKRYVPGTNVLWKTFADAVNDYITKNLDNLQVNEDKQLGAYFIKDNALIKEDEVGKITNEDGDKRKSNFAHKVLDYLWSDVSKFDHSIIFKTKTKNDKPINTLDSLIDEFKKNGISIFQENIFKEIPNNITSREEESNVTEDTDESVSING